MNKQQLIPFDIADHLDSDEAIAEYLTIVIEENDPSELAYALGVIAKKRGGMDGVAKQTGLAREGLYKALRQNSKPRFNTINRVCNALGFKLIAYPVNHSTVPTQSHPVSNTRPSC